MATELRALCFDAEDPAALGRFWGALLGWDQDRTAGESAADDGVELVPTEPTGFRLRFEPAQAPKVVRNRLHLHLTSTSDADQSSVVERALGLGARHLDVGQLPEEGHVVLEDPEGNDFCVLEPGNRFLAECGFLAEVTCDGTRAVGQFWSAALGWPLVWDQDEETSIRARGGSTNISWGGPPVDPKVGRNRQHLELVAPDSDLAAAVQRLVSLGATARDTAPGPDGRLVLADPDGNELTLVPASTLP
ncbi:VOC family protein [Phycicoccus sp. 3266]|uniref:VOC family protein n=1 Tax=Phycicoccus sp. 3266 TaxID=2817751 RepID=UPI00285F7F82|nr:VOC family protein [Phycicoccus sp. 3266]MDR6865139.1 catechol 2,3-dioxygenase-like lactoylglutathione lyase family enzyme [Phycicoccus sp. 3266]